MASTDVTAELPQPKRRIMYGINLLLNVAIGIVLLCLLPFVVALGLVIAALVVIMGSVLTLFAGIVYIFAFICDESR